MVFVSVNFSPHKGENMKISFTWKLIRKLLSLENFDRNCYTRKTRQLLHRGSLKLGA
jgi:hypothetical protein